VKSGGLDEIARAYNVEPQFVDELFEADTRVQLAYDATLRTVPSVLAEMRRDMRRDQPPISHTAAAAIIRDFEFGEGWEEEETDSDDAMKTRNMRKT
jgi:hypothetical protein